MKINGLNSTGADRSVRPRKNRITNATVSEFWVIQQNDFYDGNSVFSVYSMGSFLIQHERIGIYHARKGKYHLRICKYRERI